ncbi:MAG: 3'-5' exonuclease [Bacteroidota bacterium]|nr:3'-5' exonuclease [Bacteroidota bacterium]
MSYLDELNDIQRKAVECTEGPVMIIAGAGSGKTRVLTYRVAHLLNKGIDPFHILALTFTNKAAKEMKERIIKIVGGNAPKELWMGTFHSVFAKILRIEAEKLGYPQNFTIYDTDNSKSLIKNIIKEQELDDKIYKPNIVYNRISASKNNLISAGEYNSSPEILGEDRSVGKPKLGLLYKLYNERCRRASAMDFDDLLFNMNILLRDFPEMLYKYQNKFKYILVDEYQDTNYAQYLIIKKLAANNGNICVVGDDAQSIYSFRGANIQNILNFQKDYPDANIFKLEQNYRSTKNIVKAANSIISKNIHQIKKTIWTDNDSGTSINVIQSSTDNEEGHNIAKIILNTINNEGEPENSFAILYRTNAQSRALEEALLKHNIPYRIYGGMSFYNRKEIKDVIAYFRLVINNADEEALRRIINYPVRGIGKTTIDKITIAADQNNCSIWNIIDNINSINMGLPYGTREKINAFVLMIKSFGVQMKTTSAYDLASSIVKASGILKELFEDKSPEGVMRYENIEELLNGIKEFSEKESEAPHDEYNTRTLDIYLQDIALLTDADIEEDDEYDNKRVSLMTVHAAKGLEFPYVFIAGVEENLFPSQMSIGSRQELEEERRLFYVALTRAEKQAYISFATTRYRFGNLTYCEPSRFIEEIDSSCLNFQKKSTQNASFDEDNFENKFKSLFSDKEQIFDKLLNNNKENPFITDKSKFVNVNSVKPNNNNKINYSGLTIGSIVEHDRFGRGNIVNIEGNKDNVKATIVFEKAGQKQILLKFAKLKIVG